MGKEVQLAKRKHGVFLKATDPHVLDKAFKGVYTAWVAVLAVLKIQFAQICVEIKFRAPHAIDATCFP